MAASLLLQPFGCLPNIWYTIVSECLTKLLRECFWSPAFNLEEHGFNHVSVLDAEVTRDEVGELMILLQYSCWWFLRFKEVCELVSTLLDGCDGDRIHCTRTC